MGYDMEIVVLKRKTLDRAKAKYPKCSFSDLYTNLLFTRLYSDEYEFPEEEAGRWICSESRAIFKEYFSGSVGNGEVITIEEEEYKRMFDWLKNKLETTTLLDIARTEKEIEDLYPFIRVYREMCDTVVDFETEVVIFSHDW